jgi:hypothetical protein
MRPQITAYLHADTKVWLAKYAARLRLPKSEIVRLLIEREEQVRWLVWALSAPDPAQARPKEMRVQKDQLPPRSNSPPKPSMRPDKRQKNKRS